MNLELKPWVVPNFVSVNMPKSKRDFGFRPDPVLAVCEVDANSLSQMCDDFRAEIFRKAGKIDPRRKQ